MALLWIGLFLLGTIPHSFSRVYQERLMKRYNVSAIRMLSGVAPLQMGLAVGVLALVVLLPLPAPAPHLPPDRFVPFVLASFDCVFQGQGPPEALLRELGMDGAPPPVCALAGPLFAGFLLFNLIFNAASLALTRYTTANTAAMTSVLRLGLSSLLFTVPVVAGLATRAITRLDLLALVLLAIAILVYRYRRELVDPRREEPDADYYYSQSHLERNMPEGFRGTVVFQGLEFSSDDDDDDERSSDYEFGSAAVAAAGYKDHSGSEEQQQREDEQGMHTKSRGRRFRSHAGHRRQEKAEKRRMTESDHDVELTTYSRPRVASFNTLHEYPIDLDDSDTTSDVTL